MTSGFGKTILLGEHAVVYGHPAIAGALGMTVDCAVRATTTPTRIRVAAWGLDVVGTADCQVSRAVRALLRAMDIDESLDIRGETQLPVAAGLGSSAAFAVGLTRALAKWAGKSLTIEEVERIADHAERCFHDNPSGIDVALAARGGLGLYYRGSPLQVIRAAPIHIVVGVSGLPRRTSDMVRGVAELRQRDGQRVDAQLAELGSIALQGKELLESGDLAAFGPLMFQAHRGLQQIGVSAPVLDEMVAIAQSKGALGAKLTGAGGGGAVIALAVPGQEQTIEQAWRERGFHGFCCQVGG